MQIKTAMRYHLTWGRMAIIKKSTNNKFWRGCGKKGASLQCWWECRLIQLLWKAVWRFLKKTRNKPTIWPRNPTTGHIPWGNQKCKRHNILQCSLQHYLPELGHGSNLDVHQLRLMDKAAVVHLVFVLFWIIFIIINSSSFGLWLLPHLGFSGGSSGKESTC